MGILDLLLQAGLMAKLVLLSLLLASFFCWTVIFAKWKAIGSALRQNGEFLSAFWTGKSLEEVFAKCDQYGRSPIAQVFTSGFKELQKLPPGDPAVIRVEGLSNISRALSRASNSEINRLEKHVGWLATTASTAPFVGLFGTVWGIMNSFRGIGAAGTANLAVVAPGIAEALITTAAGIGAAIPAVVAYNHFAADIRRIGVDMDTFTQDFLNIIQRSLIGEQRSS